MRPISYLIFLFAMSIAETAFCKAIWIHATGLDTKNPSQNYETFYQEHLAFEQICLHKADRECLFFIDLSPSLMSPYAQKVLKSSLDQFSPRNLPASRSAVYSAIEDALARSGANDEVVISLKNHGLASSSEQSPSCIFFDGGPICENHIRDLLIRTKTKEKGVRVLIVANACYSGGFNNLSSRNVCVVTSSAQGDTGKTSSTKFWPLLKKGYHGAKISRLSDVLKFIDPISNSVRLGSQAETQRQCNVARSIVVPQLEFPPKDQFGLSLSTFSHEIRSAESLHQKKSHEDAQLLRAYTSGLLQRFENLHPKGSHFNCAGDPTNVCDSLNELVALEPEFTKMISSDSMFQSGAIVRSAFFKKLWEILPCIAHWDRPDKYHQPLADSFPVREFAPGEVSDALQCEAEFSL